MVQIREAGRHDLEFGNLRSARRIPEGRHEVVHLRQDRLNRRERRAPESRIVRLLIEAVPRSVQGRDACPHGSSLLVEELALAAAEFPVAGRQLRDRIAKVVSLVVNLVKESQHFCLWQRGCTHC